MTDIAKLVSGSFTQTDGLRDRWKFPSSSIFYTNPWLTLAAGGVYLVGTNPGGSVDIASQTEKSIESLGRTKPWSLYLDEDNWQADNLQRNLGKFADVVFPGGRDVLRSTFATNAMFLRDDGRLKSMAEYVFQDCWNLHTQFLDEVRPSHVLAFGNGVGSAYELFRRKLRNARTLGADLSVYNNFSIRACTGELPVTSGGLPVVLTGLPHLSRCNVANNLDSIKQASERGWFPT